MSKEKPGYGRYSDEPGMMNMCFSCDYYDNTAYAKIMRRECTIEFTHRPITYIDRNGEQCNLFKKRNGPLGWR